MRAAIVITHDPKITKTNFKGLNCYQNFITPSRITHSAIAEGRLHPIHNKTAERQEVLATLDAMPELRNRKKGHTFVLPDDVAKGIYMEWLPKLDLNP